VAQDPRAPNEERRDAITQTARQVAPDAAGLNISADDAYRLVKAFSKTNEVTTQQMQLPRKGVAKVSLDLSEEAFYARQVHLRRPVGLDFGHLRLIVKQDPVLLAIIYTRINQVQRFLRFSSQEWKPGYGLRYIGGGRSTAEADAQRFAWLSQWLTNCGAEFDPRARRRLRRDNLRDFMAKHLTDSLSLDAAPIELVPTASGRPHGFVAVDGGRVYLTDLSEGLDPSEQRPEVHERYNLHIPDPDQVIAVLAREERIQAWYTHDDLLYPIRRPSGDLHQLGYGQPEVEDLIRIVSAFLNALLLNSRGFTHNSIPQGVLTLFGDFAADDLEDFKMEWDAYASGTSHRWRLPVLISRDRESGAQYVPMGAQFSEMMFAKWMTFLVAIKGALFGIDPEEINFEAFTSRTSAISGSDTEERLASSRSKGLWPLLDWLGCTLNELVQLVDPEVEMYWTGLEPDQQASRNDEEKAATWGEYRQARGMALFNDPSLDNAPMNATFAGVYQQALQAQQMQQEQQMNPEELEAAMAQEGGEDIPEDAENAQGQELTDDDKQEIKRLLFDDENGDQWEATQPVAKADSAQVNVTAEEPLWWP